MVVVVVHGGDAIGLLFFFDASFVSRLIGFSTCRMLWIWKTVDAALDDIDAERLSLGGAETSTS